MHRITKRLNIVAAVGFLACGTSGAWAGHQPDHDGERLTAEQVGGEKRMGALLAESRILAQRGTYDAAVRNYLHVFNYGRGIARLEIVRLALIPEEIAALGEIFPPALQVLRDEVRVRAGWILTGVAGTDEMLEFISLNRALNQPRRSLELYDQLKGMGERARDTHRLMRTVLSQELLDARRFAELGEQGVGMAKRLAQRMAILETESEFSSAADEFRLEQRATVLKAVPQVYEALLSTQRDDVATTLANRMLRFDRSVSSYAALVSAARAAQRHEMAQPLMQRAGKELKPDELTELKKRLPND